ncbi:hypothetical protein TrCOL_g9991 [Triparma columacea]|uniref:DNA-directed RNA polymerase RBP11-like dimerisation domain-containing protein n=1 Tax=Triparma columacea TaxID=722753 RepID=A0A9W7LBT0_9STRA|nr:hypothetical protein TrCOL_g9991 [Triparma columacea]
MNAPERTAAFMLDEDNGEQKIKYAPSTKVPNAGTFTFNKEDHTVGNLLRMQLLLDSNVHFAGYMMPHPLINSLTMTVQTSATHIAPLDVVKNALDDLQSETVSLGESFERGLREWHEKEGERGMRSREL